MLHLKQPHQLCLPENNISSSNLNPEPVGKVTFFLFLFLVHVILAWGGFSSVHVQNRLAGLEILKSEATEQGVLACTSIVRISLSCAREPEKKRLIFQEPLSFGDISDSFLDCSCNNLADLWGCERIRDFNFSRDTSSVHDWIFFTQTLTVDSNEDCGR